MRLIVSDECLFYVVVPMPKDGEAPFADMGGRTKDWPWVAKTLRHMADLADERAKGSS